MKRFRKSIGLAAIAAVLNPLCCCFSEVVAAVLPEKEAPHSCCAQPARSETAPDKAPAGGCASEDGCPHKQIADAREVPVAAHAVAASAPTPTFVAVHIDFEFTSPATAPKWERGEQRPPGRHDPPAFLRSHSFLI